MEDNTAQKDYVSEEAPQCRPFVKWVGGKTQLLPELLKRIPKDIARYFEPFVGGGALFFSLQPKASVISDSNEELINAYQVVRDHVEELIPDLKQHLYEEGYYYGIRDADRLPEYKNWSPVTRASRLIFLNKTCYNGLYRVNSKGQFNTPFGRYVKPRIVDEENLRACSAALKNTQLSTHGFLGIEDGITSKDFVYFDPPYVPLSATSYFTSYNKEGFGLEVQRDLYALCERLDAKGIRFMLSNSSAPFVLELYKKFRIDLVGASRAINSKASKRGTVQEALITNY